MASLKRWLELRRNPWKAEQMAAFKAFRRDRAQQTRLETYGDLAPGAVVLDVGGFEGRWTDTVLSAQPRAQVHVFEPHPTFAKALGAKFAGRDNVRVHAFAIGRAAGQLDLSDDGDASSGFGHRAGGLKGEVRPVAEVFDSLGLTRVDLVKMNIEGGEYDLLPAMLDAGLMPRVARLQVQFHLFVQDLIAARADIRDGLARSHDCVWDYPFVWEEWRLRDQR